MVSSCCICSKETNPLEPQRSFHRIPANEEMRNKWFHKIGRVVSYKGARVCSDHFTENDYHNINSYSRIKRLKNTAVPSVILQKQKNTKRRSLPFQEPAVNSFNDSRIRSQTEKNVILYNLENREENHNDISETKESEITNKLLLTQGTSENLIIFLNSGKEINAPCINNQEKIDTNLENKINDINRERQFPSPNLGNSEIKEILLKMSKHNTVCFTKTDFSSDEKWTAFLRYVAYKKRATRLMLQKNKRLQKKIVTFQDMLQDLLLKI